MAHPALEWLLASAGSDDDEPSPRAPFNDRRAMDGDRDVSDHTDHTPERICFGDEQVLAGLYHTYFTELWTFASRYVHDPAAAEDIVHDVFLRLWETRATIDVWTTIRAYLFKAVANRARNMVGQIRRDDAIVPLLGEPTVPGSDAPLQRTQQDAAESADVVQAVTAVLATLPERQHLAITLRLVNDMTYAEIATVLGVTKSAVAQLITKAQAHLRQALKAYLE